MGREETACSPSINMRGTETSIREPARARGSTSLFPKVELGTTPPASSMASHPEGRVAKCLCERAGRGLDHQLDVENVASVD